MRVTRRNAHGARSKGSRRLVLPPLGIWLGLLFAGHASGEDPQLYAIAGLPLFDSGELFPVVLYRVEDGSLTKVRTVATRHQGSWFVKAYLEKGFVFVVSDGAVAGSYLVDILDLADMSRELSKDFDVCADCVLVEAWLLQRRGRLVFHLGGRGEGRIRRNLGLDLASGEFVDDIDRSDVTYVYHTGWPPGGVEDKSVFVRGIYLRPDNPTQPYVKRGADTYDLDWVLPGWFSMGEGEWLTQTANTDQMRVLFKAGGNTSQELVLDKVSQRWSNVPLSRFPPGRPRVFGRWLVQETTRQGNAQSFVDGPLGTNVSEPFLSVAHRLAFGYAHTDRMPMGTLLFYDTRTGNLVEEVTDEPDSEILLIDDGDVAYFRVGDELRSARLGDRALTEKRLVAQGPELWNVHWLVRGYE